MAIDNETKKLWAGDVWAISGDRAEVEAANPAPAINRGIGFQRSFSVDQTLNREKMNQILCELNSAAQKVKEGVSSWDATVSYPPGAVTKVTTALYYQSSSTDNTGTNPTTPGQSVWVNLGTSGTSPTTAPIALNASDFDIDGTRGDRFNLRWSVPNTGGSSITQAEVRYSKTNPPPNDADTVSNYTQGQAITITGGDADLYYAQIRVRNSIGWSPWSTAKQVRSAPLEPLGPDWITADKAGSGAIRVGWSGTRDNGLTITKHIVQWKSGTQQYSNTREKEVTNSSGYGAGSTTISPLTNGTAYSFRVKAVSSRNTVNTFSEVTATPTASPAPPDAPFVGSTALSPTSAMIFANANINNNGSAITQFRFQYKLSTEQWSQATTSTSQSSLRLLTGLTAGATYNFRIQATNAAGDGNYSTEGTVSLTTASAPGKPTAKVFRTGATSAVYCLANADIDANAPITKYRMRFRVSGASNWGADTETTDAAGEITGLVSGSTYELQMGARTSVNWGGWSDSVTIAAHSPGNVAPSGVLAAAVPGKANGTVVVGLQGTPNPGSSAIRAYTWQHKRTGTNTWVDANFVGIVGPDPAFGTIMGLTNGQGYSIRVVVQNNNSSTTSDTVSVVATSPATPTQGSPTNIVAKAERGASGTIIVGLGDDPEDNNADITSWQVEYKLNTANDWTALTARTTPTQAITGLTNGSVYNFRITARNSQGSTTSDAVNATPNAGLPPVAKPTNVSITFANTGSGRTLLLLNRDMDNGGASVVMLKWEYKRTNSDTWITAATTTAEPFHTINGLTNSSEYDARVTATNTAGSTTSSVIQFTPSDPAGPISAPSSVRATANVGRSREIVVSLALDTVSDRALIFAYRWSYKKNTDTTWTHLASSTNPTQVISNLEAGTLYNFQVRAANTKGTRTSAPVNATPVNHVPAAQSPADVVATATPGSNGSVVLGLGKDTDGRGANITGYQWQWKTKTSNTWGTLTTSSANPTYTVTGLTIGTVYQFRVKATNTAGNTTSSTVEATPIIGGPADHAPRSVSISARGTTSGAFIAYINGDIDGGLNPVTAYRWEYKRSTDSTYTGAGSNRFTNISGLTNGTTYDVRLTVTNSAGSTTTNTSVTPTDPLGAIQKPSDVVAMAFPAGTGEMVVTIGKDTVSDRTLVSGYTWEFKKNTASTWTPLASSTNPSQLITNLTSGTLYNFRVTAANTAGTTQSASVNATPVSRTPAASAPTSLVAQATPGSNGAVVLGLAKDVIDNGSTITGFQWQWKTKTSNTWGALTTSSVNPSHTATGLTVGTIYQFRVKATNGEGNITSASVEATPIEGGPAATAPKNVQLRVVNTGSGQVLMYQRGDIDNGGSPITGYQWQYKRTNSNTWNTGSSGTLGYGRISSLTNGATYTARVIVTNNVGSTTSSERSFTPSDPAGSISNPSSVRASAYPAGTGQILVSLALDTVSDRSTISGYVWQYKTNSASSWTSLASSTNPTQLISNLTAGTKYNFRVTATNTRGSTTSGSVDATPVNHTPSASAPSNISATATAGRSGQVVVGITQDPLNGGSTITAFKWEYKASTSNTWLTAGTSTNPSRTISNLTNGTTYNFRVSATNSVGTTTSSSVNATPVSGTPANSAPTLTGILTRTGASGVIDAYYARDVDDGGASISKFEWRTQDSTNSTYSSWTSTGTTPAVRFTGLTNGRLYYVEGRAVNSVSTTTTTSEQRGSARPVAPSVTTSAPSNLKVEAYDGRINGWVVVGLAVDPLDNGSPITGFQWQYKRNSSSTWNTENSSTNPTRVITGLTAGQQYNFRVKATNQRGTTTSPQFNLTVNTLPATPISRPSISAIAVEKGGSGEIIVGVESGLKENGGALSSVRYQYKRTTDSSWTEIGFASADDLTRKVSGLTNGTTYQFRGLFRNGAGTTTSPTVSIAPNATATSKPGKPTILATTYFQVVPLPSNQYYAIRYIIDTDSYNDGGSKITDFEWKFSQSNNSDGSSSVLLAPTSGNKLLPAAFSDVSNRYQNLTPFSALAIQGLWQSPTGTSTGASSRSISRRYIVAQLRWRNSVGWGSWSDAVVIDSRAER